MRVVFACLSLAFAVALPRGAAAQAVASGQLLTSSVDVTKPAAAPLIVLQIKGRATIVNFTYTGPSGQLFNQSFNAFDGPYTGKVEFQGYDSAFGAGVNVVEAFSLYTERGTWRLTSLSVCGSDLRCTSYSGHTLSALFGGKLSFEVVNPNLPDIEPPKALAAGFKLPTISLAAGLAPVVDVDVSDNLSGIGNVEVCASNASIGGTTICFFYFNAPRPIRSGVLSVPAYVLPTSTPTGTYTVYSVSLTDNAGNATGLTDAATIAKLFAGRPSFAITH
jgi:hypothetical protein